MISDAVKCADIIAVGLGLTSSSAVATDCVLWAQADKEKGHRVTSLIASPIQHCIEMGSLEFQ